MRRASAELNFRAATAVVEASASIFGGMQYDGSFTTQYYDDLAAEFCDMSVSGIDIVSYGLEAAATIRIGRWWHVDASLTAMECRYSSDPTVVVRADRDNRIIDAGSAASMGGCIAGNTPRLSGSLGVGYRSFNGWTAELWAAWAGARRAEASYLRRTERVAFEGASSPEAFDAIVTQQHLPDAFTVDLTVAKQWRLGRGSRIRTSLTLHNLTGERGNIYSAYESERRRRTTRGIQSDYPPLPSRLLYARPRTVFLSAVYTF